MRLAILATVSLSILLAGCSQVASTTQSEPLVSENTEQLVLPVYIYTDAVEGDVCRIYDNNFKVEGELMNTDSAKSGTVSYTDYDGIVQDLSVTKMVDTADASDAIRLYIQGDYAAFEEYLPDTVDSSQMEYYYYSVDGESYMNCFYDPVNSVYYSIIPYGEEYLLAESPRRFYLTLHPETIQFKNPAEDPMTYHTRSTYEELAVANTIMALQGEGSSQAAASSNGLYSSETDRQRRQSMIDYNNFNWNPDGTSDDTSVTIDTKSAAAKASQWTLQASSPYSYVNNGLKLYGLYGVKSSDTFSIQGTVDNLFDSERPWVITIKYLDSDSNLVALHTIDKTDDPIPASGTGTFSYTLSGDVDLSSITAIQFDLY